jgi:polysaccharide biosynthesis protein PslE
MLANQEKALQQTEAEEMTIREQDPLVLKLKSELVTAEIALQDLLQRYTDEDRHVQEKREPIALLRKELASAENILFTSLASQQKTLRKQIRKTSAALITLRNQKIEGDRLSRTVDLHKNAFLLYGKNLEEARIAAKLDKEQLSNVAVIEQPHAVRQADPTSQMGLVLLAAIVGVVLGVGIAFGYEFFNNTLRVQEDVERYLGLPVLAAIPDLRR